MKYIKECLKVYKLMNKVSEKGNRNKNFKKLNIKKNVPGIAPMHGLKEFVTNLIYKDTSTLFVVKPWTIQWATISQAH